MLYTLIRDDNFASPEKFWVTPDQDVEATLAMVFPGSQFRIFLELENQKPKNQKTVVA